MESLAAGNAHNSHNDLHSENGGSTFLQDLNYSYNERGWLRASNTSGGLLNLNLRYNAPTSGYAQYNGNISQMSYSYASSSGGSSAAKAFNYTYDDMNRLTAAQTTTGGALDEALTYDETGNILTLARSASGITYGTLGYSFTNSNQSGQLHQVTGTGFTTRTYGYDANGNATGDGGARTIAYNLLNLPQTVTGATNLTNYYDAAGQKLRSEGTNGGTWDYISGINYLGGTISQIATAEGRIVKNGSVYTYQYDLKDHLGNTRVTFDKNPSGGAARVLQQDEYFAFGLRKGLYDNANDNRYLYNGKEIQKDLNDQYDYGARFYDPVIGRFGSVDPKSEEARLYSVYSYAIDNPVRFIDINGEGPGDRVKAARQMTGAPYKQETGSLRTSFSTEALRCKDCSEFINRVMAADGITSRVSAQNTADLKTFLSDDDKFDHSSKPQVGDIAYGKVT